MRVCESMHAGRGASHRPATSIGRCEPRRSSIAQLPGQKMSVSGPCQVRVYARQLSRALATAQQRHSVLDSAHARKTQGRTIKVGRVLHGVLAGLDEPSVGTRSLCEISWARARDRESGGPLSSASRGVRSLGHRGTAPEPHSSGSGIKHRTRESSWSRPHVGEHTHELVTCARGPVHGDT